MAQVTISIPTEQMPDFQKYYLKRRPVPVAVPPEEQISTADWIKKCIMGDIYQTLLEGKQMEAFNELEIDIDIT